MTRGSSWRRVPAAALRGIGEQGITRAGPRRIQRLEVTSEHDHFATDLDQVGDTSSDAGQVHGDGPHSTDVRGDVFARRAVSARGTFDQETLLVAERDGKPIHLDLRQIFDGVIPSECPSHTSVEESHVLLGEHVAEAEHRDTMPDCRESPERGSADALCR